MAQMVRGVAIAIVVLNSRQTSNSSGIDFCIFDRDDFNYVISVNSSISSSGNSCSTRPSPVVGALTSATE
eukprot:scaffold307781_cov30-Tisochrysis_lutea.AAC.2